MVLEDIYPEGEDQPPTSTAGQAPGKQVETRGYRNPVKDIGEGIRHAMLTKDHRSCLPGLPGGGSGRKCSAGGRRGEGGGAGQTSVAAAAARRRRQEGR